MAKNPVLHKRSKHINIAFHITRQAVQAKVIAPCYIGTDDNIADLMTKSLAKTLHNRHVGQLMVDVVRGKLFSVSGDRLTGDGRPPVRDELYVEAPRGLGRPSELLSDVMKTFTSDFAEEGGAGAVDGTAEQVSGSVGRMVDDYAARIASGVVSGNIGGKDFAALASTLGAIVDSGASMTYVPERVRLSDAAPGTGHVSTAEGRKRAVVESGSYGPLRNAQKVPGFTRVLVSVLDLAEQFGGVRFDVDGVYVVSGSVETKIGSVTASRLYSFDLLALQRHVERLG
jgi:hypothetical protein